MAEIKTSWFLFGRQIDIPNQFSTPNNFRFCRFYYILDGECIYKDSNETMVLKKGYIYLIPQKSYSLNYGESKKFLHIYGHFQIDNFEIKNIMEFEPKKNPVCTTFVSLIDSFSENHFTKPNMEDPSYIKNMFSDDLLFPITEKIFSAFINYLLVDFTTTEEEKPSFDTILTYINNNLAADLSNETLAKITLYSRTHFIQEFTKRYQISPQKYVMKARISHAIVLLMHDEKLYNIAYKVGYDNPKSFSRAFKRETGYSPQEYKDIHYYRVHNKTQP